MKRIRWEGFTKLDLAMVGAAVCILVILGGLSLPGIRGHRRVGCRISCVSNLKQVGLGLRMWSNDHEERFPWQVPVAEGGTKELANLPYAALHFLAASNELNSPKILQCPADPGRLRTNVWNGLWQNNVSYFVGLEANETLPTTLLSGDRNVSTNDRSISGLLTITNAYAVQWTAEVHKKGGNIGFADGSISQSTTDHLRRAIRNALEQSTNGFVRLAIP